MHEIEWRDWVRQYLGGLEAQIAALRSSETRVAALEGKWREADARRRSAVGGRGNKPIGVVPKAEVVRLSVSPRCAPRGSVAGSFLLAFRTATPTRYRPQRRAGAASRSRIGMESAPSNLTAARD